MKSVVIDSGNPEAPDRFAETPKDRWLSLMLEKRRFIETNINFDCRCLVEFVAEAEDVWEELGFDSAADMIRNGYLLDPVEIELAVAWLKHNEPDAAVAIGDVKSKVAAAKERPLAKHGGQEGNENAAKARVDEAKANPLPIPRPGQKNEVDNINSVCMGGTSADYTLRRLARDAPEMLDRVESGELTVNQAAIEAGIRKRQIQVPVGDPRAAAKRLLKHYSKPELIEAIQLADAQ